MRQIGMSQELLRFRICIACLGIFMLLGGAGAAWASEIRYQTQIEGVRDAGLLNLLSQSSQLKALEGSPPATATGLRRRAQDDLGRLNAVLRSEGYYDGEVGFRLVSGDSGTTVYLDVETGQRFDLRSFSISYDGVPPRRAPHAIADLGAVRGQPATGRLVLSLQAQVLDTLHNNGYPFAEISSRDARAILETHGLDVDLNVALGPMVTFGSTNISGLTRIDQSFVLERITWQAGEPFSRQKLRDTHTGLEGTGLFGSVAVNAADTANAAGQLDVNIEAAERAPRTVGVGLRFGTSEGAGARAYWEHRNILGRGENLRFEAQAAEIHQELSAQLRQPGFLRPNQQLITGLSVFNTVAESYDETGITGSIGLERQLDEDWLVHGRVEVRASLVDEGDVRRDTRLLQFPTGASYNSSNDVFDPDAGARLSLVITPSIGSSETDLLFTSTEIRGSFYEGIGPGDRIILAMRFRAGSILGEGTRDLPASDRFYSGGGGSVRGIGYQLAGPLDGVNDPIGGRSVFEVGAEARLRVGQRFGIVPFIEGGSAFSNDIPDFSEDLRWGAGIGVRYYTPVGPVRLDVAIPLDRREGIDDVVQIYLSLGQAF